MKSSDHWLGRLMAVLLITLLASPAGHSGTASAQQAAPGGSQAASSLPGAATASTKQQPDDATVAESALPENPAPANAQAPAQEQQPATQPAPAPPQDNSHRPLGTAAAPYEPTTGIAASRPAGAAIAPAKQRRVRTFLISLGVIAGAGIAVGSVAALSHGSPSRP